MVKPITDWNIRITKYSTENPKKLKANSKNWREHPPKQREALVAAIDEIGVIAPVIMSEVTGELVDGHLRVDLAIERNEKEIPVVWTDLSQEEADIALATFDPITLMASASKKQLDTLLAGLPEVNENLHKMLDEMSTPQMIDDFPGEGNSSGVRARPGKVILVNIGKFVGRTGEEDVQDICDVLIDKFGDDEVEGRIEEFLAWLKDKILQDS